MAKSKSSYFCQECGANFGKWTGQCSECGAWNSLTEAPTVTLMPHHKATATNKKSSSKNYAGEQSGVIPLNAVPMSLDTRLTTGVGEFDRVLGGGLVAGSVVLIGGDPGIGKSTILLQTAIHMASNDNLAGSALYVTGEESLSQVAMRATRLGLPNDRLKVLAETNVETICHALTQEQPAIAVIDSIQTIYTEAIQSAQGA